MHLVRKLGGRAAPAIAIFLLVARGRHVRRRLGDGRGFRKQSDGSGTAPGWKRCGARRPLTAAFHGCIQNHQLGVAPTKRNGSSRCPSRGAVSRTAVGAVAAATVQSHGDICECSLQRASRCSSSADLGGIRHHRRSSAATQHPRQSLYAPESHRLNGHQSASPLE